MRGQLFEDMLKCYVALIFYLNMSQSTTMGRIMPTIPYIILSIMLTALLVDSKRGGFLENCPIVERLSTDHLLVKDNVPGCGHIQAAVDERGMATLDILCKLRNICYNCKCKCFERSDITMDSFQHILVHIYSTDK